MHTIARWQQAPGDILDYDPDGLGTSAPAFSLESLACLRCVLMRDLARPTTREGRSSWVWRQTHRELLQVKVETGRR